jgi:hypothetical protein
MTKCVCVSTVETSVCFQLQYLCWQPCCSTDYWLGSSAKMNSISLWDDVIWQGYHPSHIIIPCSLCCRRDQTQYSVSQSIRMAYEIIYVFPEGTRNLTEHVMLLWKHASKDVTVSLSSLICGRWSDIGDRFASSPSVARCQLGCCLTSTGY